MSSENEVIYQTNNGIYKFVANEDNRYWIGFLNDEKITKLKDTLCEILKYENSEYNKNWSCNKLIECLKKVLERPTNINEIRKIIISISTEETSKEGYSFTQQREIINQIFKDTEKECNLQSIMLRLIVIDSLYSTNAEYSYFSFEEMAKAIFELGKCDNGNGVKTINDNEIQAVFSSIVEENKIHNKRDDAIKLFSKKYGIRKNGSKGSRQTSLMSKYANYTLLQNPAYNLGFPIYDSLAIEMYPKVCEHLAIKPKFTKNSATDITIDQYITALNDLRLLIFEGWTEWSGKWQQYDILDAYLWRMGKFNNGNYSLLFNEGDYEQFIKNIGLHQIEDKDLYTKFKNTGLVTIKQNNKKQDEYEYDFNTLVRFQCANMKFDDIVNGLSNKDSIKNAITHWRDFYK